MPTKAETMLAQIMNGPVSAGELSMHDHGGWGVLKPGHSCSKPSPVFPRME